MTYKCLGVITSESKTEEKDNLLEEVYKFRKIVFYLTKLQVLKFRIDYKHYAGRKNPIRVTLILRISI